MAAGITTSLVRKKLVDLKDRIKIQDPRSSTQVDYSISNLKVFKTTLNGLEDDQGSHLTTDDGEIIKLLGAVYEVEDHIDAFLARATLQERKFFPSIHLELNRRKIPSRPKFKNFVQALTKTVEAQSDHVKPRVLKVQPSKNEHVIDVDTEADNSGLVSDDTKISQQSLRRKAPQLEIKSFDEGASKSHFSDGNDTSDLDDTAPTKPDGLKTRAQISNSLKDIQVQPENEPIVDGNTEADVSGYVDDTKVPPQKLPSHLEDVQVPQLENNKFGKGASESNFSDEHDTPYLGDIAKKLEKTILHDYLSLFILLLADRPGDSHKRSPLWTTYCSMKEHFECCVWIQVSDESKAKNYVMEQLTGMKQEKGLPPLVPQGRLSRFLSNKKYLLVFYDLRTPEIWESLTSVLPNSDVSRVILSFRGIDTAPDFPNARFLGTISGTELELPLALNKDVCHYLDEETDVVGLKDEIKKLHQLICRGNNLNFMILVVGPAGSGKTTLVQTVYNHSHIQKKFEKRAWVSVSKVFEERNLLLQILKQVTKDRDEEKLSLEELRKKLRNIFLGQRYLVVLDDVQTPDAWKNLERVFPVSFLNGSRVVLTIRNLATAKDIDQSIYSVYKLRSLTDDESWALFLQKVIKTKRLNDSDLMKLKKKILQKCRGLPLAISMLGGLLSTKEATYDAWLNVIESTQQRKKEEGRASEQTKQGEKDEERVSEHTKREKTEKGVGEHTQQGEIEEEKVFGEEKRVSGHTRQGEIEEEKVVGDEKRVSEHTHQGEIEEEKMFGEGKRGSWHIQQGEIEEEGVAKEDKMVSEHTQLGEIEEEERTGNASFHKNQGEDQSISSNESASLDNLSDSDILALGYQDLTPPLRACLHYSCIFPRSDPILVRRLVRLWIAEGLLLDSLTSDNNEPPPETEDMVQNYLEELEQRNMIEVASKRSDGRPKTCRVPGLIYDLLCGYAGRMGYFHVHPNSDPESKLPSKLGIRRLAEQVGIDQNNPPSDDEVQQLRSYISFNRGKGDKPVDAVDIFLKRTTMKRGFGLLTLLDLEGVYKPVLRPETLKKLPLLRYVGLRWTFLDEIPDSVGDIPHLETLDVKHTNITTLPISICKAKKLRHLYMNGNDFETSSQRQISSSSLTNLQTLSGLLIGNSSPTINWLTGLSSLRKLRLTCHTNSVSEITNWLHNQTSLRSLQLRSVDDDSKPSDLNFTFEGRYQKLTDLYLVGVLPKEFNLNDLPPNLRVLTLSVSQLSEDPMPILGELEHLKVLRLFADSYRGVNMTCRAGGFPKLQDLKLWMLMELGEWTIEDEAMPTLVELEIRYCPKLRKPELEKLDKLETLTLTNMNDDFVDEVERCMSSRKTEVIPNKWEFIPSWELSQEQQQEIQQRSEHRDAALESVKSNSQNNKAPHRQMSRLGSISQEMRNIPL